MSICLATTNKHPSAGTICGLDFNWTLDAGRWMLLVVGGTGLEMVEERTF